MICVDFNSVLLRKQKKANLILRSCNRKPAAPPMRYAEFGRAISERLLAGRGPEVTYLGLVKESQKDNITGCEEMVYKTWDANPHSPAAQRPRPEQSRPPLTVLLWQQDKPVFPPSLLEKFPEGTAEHSEVLKLKKDMETVWPSSASPVAAGSGARASGFPDLSNASVLDLTREVDLEKIPVAGFSADKPLGQKMVFWLISVGFQLEEKPDDIICLLGFFNVILLNLAAVRLALCPGRNTKPSILISKNYDIFVGNMTNDAFQVSAGELFGFNVGSFERRPVSGAWVQVLTRELFKFQHRLMKINMSMNHAFQGKAGQ